MRYSELKVRLKRLKPHGIEQVGRLTIGQDSTVFLGYPHLIVFPFQFECHNFYAPAGEEDFWLDPEEIAALLRRFGISMDQFTATANP